MFVFFFFSDRNRYRYPKGPRDWRNIKDAISFHRKKRENLLILANDYPESCTVMTHSGRLVLLNDATSINEIFIGRADLVSNKVDGYLENQLRYKEGKHIRTGIVFRHQDHNARIIHRALVNHINNNLIGKRLDLTVQEQLKNLRLSENFDVRRTTFYFAVRLLTSLSCSSTSVSIDDKTFELFEQNLYKISKAIHEDTIEKSAKAMLTQLTGLSETLDINENVLDYIKTWTQTRRNESNPIENVNDEQVVTSTTTINNDFLDSIVNVIDESSPRLDEDDIAACILDIVMHGSEMLKGALSWLLLYVVKYPEEADACRREARYVRQKKTLFFVNNFENYLVIMVIQNLILHLLNLLFIHKHLLKKFYVYHLLYLLLFIQHYKILNGVIFIYKNVLNLVAILLLYIIQLHGMMQQNLMLHDGLEKIHHQYQHIHMHHLVLVHVHVLLNNIYLIY